MPSLIFALPNQNLGNGIGLWCKGSTTDFDSVCLGSNPSNPTKKRPEISSGRFFTLKQLNYFITSVITCPTQPLGICICSIAASVAEISVI